MIREAKEIRSANAPETCVHACVQQNWEKDNCHRLTLRSLRPDLLNNFLNISMLSSRLYFDSIRILSEKLNATNVKLIFDQCELSPCQRFGQMRTPRRHATKYCSESVYRPIYQLSLPDLIVPHCTNFSIPTLIPMYILLCITFEQNRVYKYLFIKKYKSKKDNQAIFNFLFI